jgi:hypothetical protein
MFFRSALFGADFFVVGVLRVCCGGVAGVRLYGRRGVSGNLRCGADFIRSGSGVRERASLERPSLFSSPSL